MSDINHNRMIPIHIADAAVAACEAEIQKLKEENARLNLKVKRLYDQRAKLIKSAEHLFEFIGVDLCDSIEHLEAAWEAAKGNPPPDDMDFQEQQDIRLNR